MDDVGGIILFALMLLFVPFALPIGLWVALYRTRSRLAQLESALHEQQAQMERLSSQLAQLGADASGRSRAERATPASPPERPTRPEAAPVPPPVEVPRPSAVAPPPSSPVVTAPPAQPERPVPPPVAPAPPATPPGGERAPTIPARPEKISIPPRMPTPVVPRPEGPPATAAPSTPLSVPPAAARTGVPPPSPPQPPRPPAAPPPPPAEERAPFDWESLIGVKLFSAIAGVALVFAAILFLRYSMQQGWLQPPVRVLIGVAVGVTLLILCELKAARKYPATANALDAAAIAILFATFFSAHALWNLIPAFVTFGLLAAVTALAVLLSIRRESLFIAVLGLLGGFSTPALLSTGENRPIPLFAYLALLNVGLAWVAYRQVWPILTVLTLVLTTLYQWIWVFKFLTANDLSLAMGIFALFPVLTVAGLILGRRGQTRPHGAEERAFEGTAVFASALPLAFVVYLAAVPAYGARPDLLFGFLLLIVIGLFVVSLTLRRGELHAVGALAAVVVWAVWLTAGYRPDHRTLAIAFTFAFVVFYLFAPSIAAWRGRALVGRAATAIYAAPALLFVFVVVARIDPAASAPAPLFAPLLILLALCAWRAIALERGATFFIASFLAVAAQAAWSATHLTIERLPSAVVVYAIFGIVATAVPVLARRRGRPLQPEGAAGVVLLMSLGLLLFLARGPMAPVALWALALLLAIQNAGLFIESASSRLPLLSQAGSVLSWAILAVWWYDTAGAVGVLPSLAVLTGLTLITLAGHAWAYHSTAASTDSSASDFANGLALGLIGHLFLFFVAVNREWSLPPWPVFGALGVITLACSVTAMFVRTPLLHVAGATAGALVVAAWTAAAGVAPWTSIGVAAAAVLSFWALAWIAIARGTDRGGLAREAAAMTLFGGEVTTVLASAAMVPPPFVAVLASHVANLAAILTLTALARWKHVTVAALAVSGVAIFQWQEGHDLQAEWPQLLVLSGAIYALFTGYALIVGPREPERREPWLVALGAAALTFVAAREAFEAGDLEWMIGVVPVVLGAVTAILLRSLLRLETPGQRDLTRLALVAGVALAFVTVAIPLQLDHQWITIGWALEGAALAWLYGRVPHRGVLLACAALFVAVFVRLALNPSIWTYEPRGELRIVNWYLYTYLIAAASLLVGARFLARTEDRVATGLPRLSHLFPAAATVLLFLLLNIEIADYYATGPEITFRFGVTVSQDLTYTIGWLAFGMLLLAVGIYVRTRPARIAAVALIAVTTFKCFLYDLKSLEGLYRIASFVGLAISLALVSIALQKYVLAKPKGSV